MKRCFHNSACTLMQYVGNMNYESVKIILNVESIRQIDLSRFSIINNNLI